MLSEAAEYAGVSERTVRNWATARLIGKIEHKGRVFYKKTDLARMDKSKRVEAPAALERTPPLMEQLVAAAQEASTAVARYIDRREEIPHGAIPVQHWEAWLSYDRAALYSGIGVFYLRALVQQKVVREMQIGAHGQRVLNRADLDRFSK